MRVYMCENGSTFLLLVTRYFGKQFRNGSWLIKHSSEMEEFKIQPQMIQALIFH